MLRQKHILGLTIQNVRRNISLLSLRNVHVSDSFCLRKVSAERKRTTEFQTYSNDQCIAGEFQSREDTNANFYGIEGDEGVINCEIDAGDSSHVYDSFFNKVSKKSAKEEFKKTSFGAVRYDAPNKPLFHGQYEKFESNFEFPLERDMFKGRRKLKSFVIEDTGSNTFNEGNAESIRMKVPTESAEKFRSEPKIKSSIIDEQYFNLEVQEMYSKSVNIQKEVQNESTEKLTIEPNIPGSVIDEQYFSPEILEEKIIDNHPCEKTFASENLNFIDDAYFHNKLNHNNAVERDESSNPVQLGTDIREQFDSENFKSEDNLSIIEEQYLPDKILQDSNFNFEKSLSDNESTSKNHLNDKYIKVNSSESLKYENMGFLDELFFNNELKNEGNVNSVKNANIPQVDTGFFNKAVKRTENSDLEDNIEKIYSSNTNESFITDKGSLKQDKLDKISSKTINRVSPKKFIATTNFKNNFNQDNILNSSNSNVMKEVIKDTVRSEKSTLAEKKLKSLLQEARNSVRATNSPRKSAGNSKSLLISSQQTEPKSSANSQNLSQETDQVETAQDYVKKLRSENKIIHSELKDGKYIQKEVKLDQQGFRVLKNQVPNLVHYTRNEIVDLLVKNVLYSDSDVVVLNKPYSLVMHESKTTKNACCLSQYLDDVAAELDKTTKNPKLITVHRLDKETTGCLLLARNEEASLRLTSLFAQKKISKTYWIVTIRVPDSLEGVIDIPISEGTINGKTRMVLRPNLSKDMDYANHCKGGKRAVTNYKVVAESGNAALVEVSPETGIKHQIRVHFGFGLSCPILGDHKYSYTDKLVPQKLSPDLLQRLHVRQSKVRHIPMHIYARSILIPQYSEGRNLFVTAPMPFHMSKNLQSLKFKKKK